MVAGDGYRSAYRAVNSCLLLVPAAVHREFITFEALAQNGKLCEAQAAMAAAGCSQCGYCTPGFVSTRSHWCLRSTSHGRQFAEQVRATICETFGAFESSSIQQIMYQIGTKMLTSIPAISE